MSGVLGLKNNFGERIFHPWMNLRGNINKPGRPVGLLEFMRDYANGTGIRNATGEPVTLADLWRDFGINPESATLENIVSTGDGGKWLAPSVAIEFITRGIEARPWHASLCKQVVSVGSKTVEAPYIEHSGVEMTETAEAETIASALQASSEKTVSLKKRAVGIWHSNEFLMSSALPLIRPFLEEVGFKIAADRNRRAVQALVNGDGGKDLTGSPVADSCAVIGTATGNSLQFKDFVRAWARGTGLYLNWKTLITSEETANEVLELSQFTQPQGLGTALVSVDSATRVIPAAMPHFVSSEVADGDCILVDPDRAMVHAVFMPLWIDTEKIASRQIQGTFVSIIDGFVTLKREARCGIRKTLAFSGNGFPSWMTPLD